MLIHNLPAEILQTFITTELHTETGLGRANRKLYFSKIIMRLNNQVALVGFKIALV